MKKIGTCNFPKIALLLLSFIRSLKHSLISCKIIPAYLKGHMTKMDHKKSEKGPISPTNLCQPSSSHICSVPLCPGLGSPPGTAALPAASAGSGMGSAPGEGVTEFLAKWDRANKILFTIGGNIISCCMHSVGVANWVGMWKSKLTHLQPENW